MDLRVLQVFLPGDRVEEALPVLEEHGAELLIREALDSGATLLQVVHPAEGSEDLLDELETAFGDAEGFRMVLLPVTAAIPREAFVEEESPEEEKEEEAGESRISRDELYATVTTNLEITRPYLALVALASVVAAVGLVRDETIVIIGAMVIAPLLTPNVAVALGTTLADVELVKRGVANGLAGVGVALAVAAVTGFTLGPNVLTEPVLEGIRLDLPDMVLALAAGGAGVVSVTVGFASALVGVMVAVALLPPTVACGLLLGSARWAPAGDAALLVLANVIAINLAGVLAFLLQGVRPLSWWEEERARRATRWAILLWTVLLAALALVVWLAE
ncbi:MAG: TIGR00341 family protein [Gemmatimonadota bacterium]|nr:TIGR00341 family protein [Gemmatimonadota bacterium]